MNRTMLLAAVATAALGAATPAAASLVGTTASTTTAGSLSVAPASATVVSSGAEFTYSLGSLAVASGNVEADSFTLTFLIGIAGSGENVITLTLNPVGQTLTGITVTENIVFFEPGDVTYLGNVVTLNLGDFDALGSNRFATVTFTFADVVSVPEPASLLLFGAGLVGLAGAARRRPNAAG